MKLIDTLNAYFAQLQDELNQRLQHLQHLEQLWDARVTRLLSEHPALAGDCAYYRDLFQQQVQAVKEELSACETLLAGGRSVSA